MNEPKRQRRAPQQETIQAIGEKDPLAWAHRLRQREMRCEKLTQAQRDMWREAFGQRTSGYLDDPRGDGT